MSANSLQNISPVVRLNGSPVTSPQQLSNGSYVDASAGGSCDVFCDASVAAHVQGTSVRAYLPPTSSLDRVYYGNSYRYKLVTPTGYIGIRG